ncbi:hypothetical protein JYU34_005033 [Plutella xylostella]|uniref:Uncharacterized protein n=1 Tax=Plutella xylostella TaxID=51655 RepID=A0ABQ7QVQ3_PLUXY|nr:hypothetical protein JYU34_005033 [Plutella xylostella]
MACQSGDNKKLFKVFDATRQKSHKRRDRVEEHSPVTDGSTSGGPALQPRSRPASGMPSLQDMSALQLDDITSDLGSHRRQGMSLALKGGRVSTPRSISPNADNRKREDAATEVARFDEDSIVYAFLEDAIKRDKKKRHGKRHEEVASPERDSRRKHHHKHRHRDDASMLDHKSRKESPPPVNQITETIVETFAKLCAQFNDNGRNADKQLPRQISNKSLQCLVENEIDQRPTKLRSPAHSREESPASRVRSHMTIHQRPDRSQPERYKDPSRHPSKQDMRRRDEYPILDPRRSRIEVNNLSTRGRHSPEYCYRDYDREHRHYEEDKKRQCEQKTSRSFDIHRERYEGDNVRRTFRSDDKNYECRHRRFHERGGKKFEDRERFYEDRPREDKGRGKRNVDHHLDRLSVASRDDDYRERLSERERDSGSVADGASTVSDRSNYLKFVKQEIAEQRESMDKMMKLWKELMKCFKGVSKPQDQNLKSANATAEQARDSAASQLRLWRECMRRYETVARDVGDTDTRLKEEINKQRQEMAEMAAMWQECLQRYRDMSSDFNKLKQKVSRQLETPEPPTRLAAPAAPCAEGEPQPYRVPPPYPPPQPQLHHYAMGGSPLRGRASAPPPPPWHWWGEGRPRRRRQGSQESRGSGHSRDRRRRSRSRPRERRKDRDESRYKDKPSKTSAARSEHKPRKR